MSCKNIYTNDLKEEKISKYFFQRQKIIMQFQVGAFKYFLYIPLYIPYKLFCFYHIDVKKY